MSFSTNHFMTSLKIYCLQICHYETALRVNSISATTNINHAHDLCNSAIDSCILLGKSLRKERFLILNNLGRKACILRYGYINRIEVREQFILNQDEQRGHASKFAMMPVKAANKKTLQHINIFTVCAAWDLRKCFCNPARNWVMCSTQFCSTLSKYQGISQKRWFSQS